MGTMPIYVCFFVFGAALFGSRSSRFKTVEATATTLFAVMNGDEMRDTFMDLIYVMNGYVQTCHRQKLFIQTSYKYKTSL